MTLVLAAMRDKDVVGMVRELGSHEALRDGRMIAVALRGPRAMGTAELRDTWLQERPGSQAGTARAPGEALELALASARSSGGPIVVAGSLALVGAIRGIVLGSGV